MISDHLLACYTRRHVRSLQLLKPALNRYLELAIDAALAGAAYAWFGWSGVAVIGFVVFAWFFLQIVENQQTHTKLLTAIYSRLPDRCAFCHREIVAEGGIINEEGDVYHSVCSDKVDALESLRKEAGVPASEALHLRKAR